MALELEHALRAVLPEDAVLTDPAETVRYERDMARFCPAGEPAAVVLPRRTIEVQAVLRVAREFGTAVVAQGARTGLAGAANALDGCVVVCLERMDRIVEVDEVNRLAVVEPGVLNAALAEAAASRGLAYPPDPGSRAISTIGGNVATNAGGLCCVKYGVTADYVLGLEVVLADGRVLRTGRRTVKGVAGYDLTHLFVGSEGTLGIITEITLALRPAAHPPLTVVAMFPSTTAAADAVTAVTATGHVPSLFELMDRTTLRAVRAYAGVDIPADAAAMLVAQSDAPGEQARREVAEMAAVFRASGALDVALATDPARSASLLRARQAAHFALKTLGTTLTEDVCVPRSRLAEFIDRVEEVATGAGLVIGIVGHAGDGNLHTTIVFDEADPAQVRRTGQAAEEIMLAGLRLGGTITGEHGIGLFKAPLLEQEIGPVAMGLHRDIKLLFDPNGTLNPGKVFSSPTAPFRGIAGRDTAL